MYFKKLLFICSFLVLIAILPSAAVAENYYSSAVMKDQPINYWRFGETFLGRANNTVVETDAVGNYENIYSSVDTHKTFLDTTLNDDNDKAVWLNGNPGSWVQLMPKDPSTGMYNPKLAENFTVEFWFKLDIEEKPIGSPLTTYNLFKASGSTMQIAASLENQQTKISADAEYIMPCVSSSHQTRTLTSIAQPSDRKWHHLAVTSNKSDFKLYLDGNLAASQTYNDCSGTSHHYNISGTYGLGYSWSASNVFSAFKGGFDELAIYNSVLDATQINQHYNLAQKASLPLSFVISQKALLARYERGFVSPPPTAQNGNPSNFTISPALPRGLSLNSTTGVITGTPLTLGNSDARYTVEEKYYTLTATDAEGHKARTSFLLTLQAPLEYQYRPSLYFDSNEKWRPLDVDKFLSEGADYNKPHQLCVNHPIGTPIECSAFQNWADLKLQTSNTLSSPNPISNIYLDLYGNASNPSEFRSPLLPTDSSKVYYCNANGFGDTTANVYDCDRGDRSKMYYHVVPADVNHSEMFLDYWVFYRLNHLVLGVSPDATHEGDWEGVSVALDPDDTSNFKYVAMASHDGVWKFLPSVMSCMYHDGIVTSDTVCGEDNNPNVNPKASRPKTFVANGSHASYPRSCEQSCKQVNETGIKPHVIAPGTDMPEGTYNGQKVWLNNDVLNTLVAFPSSNNWDPSNYSLSSWTDWAGSANSFPVRWGNELDSLWGKSPSSPGLQGRYTNPYAETHCSTRWSSQEGLECGSSPLVLARNTESLSDQEACAQWFGPNIQMAICDPQAAKGEKNIEGSIVQTTSQKDILTTDFAKPNNKAFVFARKGEETAVQKIEHAKTINAKIADNKLVIKTNNQTVKKAIK